MGVFRSINYINNLKFKPIYPWLFCFFIVPNLGKTRLEKRIHILKKIEKLVSTKLLPSSNTNRGGNKLRTISLFKSQFKTEHFCKIVILFCHRSAFSIFICGVAPLYLETGRLKNTKKGRECVFIVMILYLKSIP